MSEWFQVPEELVSDPAVKFMMDERQRAADTLKTADDALRSYVLRQAEEVPEDLLPQLTKVQAKVLDIIVRNYRMHGVVPTAREVGRQMGWSSNNSAVVVMNTLCKKGYVYKTKGKWRSTVPLFDKKKKRIKKSS